MLAQLCASPGQELHVLALMGAVGDQAPDAGDAGALLDADAIADYRARLAELDEELAEAEGWADAGRAARVRAEREAIVTELARGVGLGGRERRAGGAAERARTNVQRRIRGAIRKIGETLPALGDVSGPGGEDRDVLFVRAVLRRDPCRAHSLPGDPSPWPSPRRTGARGPELHLRLASVRRRNSVPRRGTPLG